MAKKIGILACFFATAILFAFLFLFIALPAFALEQKTIDRSTQMRYFVVISVALLAITGIIMSLLHMLHKMHRRKKEAQKQEQSTGEENQGAQEQTEEEYEQYSQELQDYSEAVMAHERFKEAMKSKASERYKLFDTFEEKDASNSKGFLTIKTPEKFEAQQKKDAKSAEEIKKLRRKIERQLQDKIDWIPLSSLSDPVFMKISMLAAGKEKRHIDRIFRENKDLKEKIISHAKNPTKETGDYIFSRLSQISGKKIN